MVVSSYYASWRKTAFDTAVAIGLLLLSWPIMIIIVALILITSPGPLIFTQSRLGRHQKPFQMFKFRTMYPNAERDQKRYWTRNQAPSPMFKLNHDPRFVGVGRFLSLTGLDELPQLVNILKGDMSFVGPRPLPVTEAKKLDSSWHFRYQVKPGIFSDWSLSNQKYRSLATWKKLDQTTLALGSLKRDAWLITQTLKIHLWSVLRELKKMPPTMGK